MADLTATPAPTPAAPVAAPVATPSPAPAASPLPAADAPAAPSPALPSGDGAAPTPEAAPPPAAPEPSTVLGEALKPAETPKPDAQPDPAKPAEGQGDAPQADGGQSAEPAPPPTYEPFKLPDGLTVEQERLGQFTSLLGEFESQTKADHAAVQALGQKLVDFHIAEVQKGREAMQKAYQDAFEQQKTVWKNDFLKDPEIGGNRADTTVNAARDFIRRHGGTEEQQAEFRDLMEKTGLGNHPVMIRLLANAGRAMGEGKPLAAKAPPPAPKSKIQALYGKSS